MVVICHLIYYTSPFMATILKEYTLLKSLLIKKMRQKLNEGKRVTYSCNSLICYWLIRTILLKTLLVKLGRTKRGQR